jgi:hypothetical protein
MNATKALKGRIRKPANTLIRYNLGCPLSTLSCRAAIDPLRTFRPGAYHAIMTDLVKQKPVEKPE